jgi:hypothetical protein
VNLALQNISTNQTKHQAARPQHHETNIHEKKSTLITPKMHHKKYWLPDMNHEQAQH